ncbi:RNA polymerase sigma factor [Catellatospora sp. KI3]|uniref:sigma-70 family RNA polymerase sigma factor n=1 Tax=Catellatospora sp. KI3 TaxID=3041620 RepID=UPI002482ECA5|nr:RNA polymerase sigma factor [Catellatospora sp. KI3]MDI1459984.1 RNA polymerase sigma factor [Catellatospora sp. KI3]
MGAHEELGELYHAGYRRLVTQVFAFTTDLTEAQDAVQEAFARALARRRGLSDVDAPEAWLRTVAINVVRRRWRRRQLLDTILLRERPLARLAAPPPEPDNTDLREALAVIPRQYREVIVLHYLADLPLDEVAQLLEVPVGTVKSRLSRGRDALRGLLDDVEAPPLAEVRARAGRIRRRRQAAQVGSLAAAVLTIAVVVLPWQQRSAPEPLASARPSASAGPSTYTGSGLSVIGVVDPGTTPDLPGQINELELDGAAGWLRTSCKAAERDCRPAFARTDDGGLTWYAMADPGLAPPAPASPPPLTGAWTARRPTPAGVWWAAGLHGSLPALAASTDGGKTWQRYDLSGPADSVTATVRGEQVLAVVGRRGALTGVYTATGRPAPGTAMARVSDGDGLAARGEPVLLPDGRLLLAGVDGRLWLSDDLGAVFRRAQGTLPGVDELRATSSGYAALGLFNSGWVAVSDDGVTWRKLPIR